MIDWLVHADESAALCDVSSGKPAPEALRKSCRLGLLRSHATCCPSEPVLGAPSALSHLSEPHRGCEDAALIDGLPWVCLRCDVAAALRALRGFDRALADSWEDLLQHPERLDTCQLDRGKPSPRLCETAICMHAALSWRWPYTPRAPSSAAAARFHPSCREPSLIIPGPWPPVGLPQVPPHTRPVR